MEIKETYMHASAKKARKAYKQAQKQSKEAKTALRRPTCANKETYKPELKPSKRQRPKANKITKGSILQRFSEFKVSHTFREGNQCADLLAKLSLLKHED
ncbi:uncharacterized protein G2W53_021207 [Senna tora]|uniref:RNase H type-1 domain-containing protein n=1 Tax=Senna tora TaxID=362788 RepID=A0A834TJ09_9FABA|nr:uncharacterized protein G2W53_021207 [Senna tora]